MKKYGLTFFIAISILLLTLPAVSSKVTKKGNFFYDEHGRTVLFRGMNVVFKLDPYIPQQDKFDPYLSLSDRDIDFFIDNGFNVVRLGVMWESIEMSYNNYNLDLLDQYEKLVNRLGEHGIKTIVDAHQDILSRKFCGEGVPTFYLDDLDYDKQCSGNLLKRFLHMINVCKSISEYKFRYDDQGRPLLEDCHGHFVDLHTSPDVTSVYKKLYSNANGLLDRFIQFWKVVATKFKENQYVIGYDLWNEPFPGGLFDDLKMIIPGKADNLQLLNFYKSIDTNIREIDPNYVMLFEPMTFPDKLQIFNWMIPYTFDHPPLQSHSDTDKQMYNFHSYCCSLGWNVCKNSEPDISYKDKCRTYHFNAVRIANDFSSKFGIGQFLTEFGACLDTESCYHEITSVADACDKYLTSWAYWQYKPYKDFTTTCPDDKEGIFYADGTVQQLKLKALSRTYVQAFQGLPISMNFNAETKEFLASFKYKKDVKASTVLFLNKQIHYPNGYNLKLLAKSSNPANLKPNFNETSSFSVTTRGENYITINVNEDLEDGTELLIHVQLSK